MNISPVSFRSAESFQQMISRPQAYVAQNNTAVASTGIEDKPKKKGGFKKFLAFVALAAAAVAGITYGAKKGVFKVANPEEGNKILNTVKQGLDSFGTKVGEVVSKYGKKATEAAEAAVDNAPKA